ncbi:MAG: hypothetical protein HIU92_02570 [Proteobacteria bacterium]|nr:hypothetical protein [Pseudomonadota bacterium]
MPNIIDSLIVALNLDATGFKRGQEEANKSLEDTKRRVDRTATDIEKHSKRTNTALRSVDVQASSVGKSVAESGRSMLAPFADLAMHVGLAAVGLGALKEAFNAASTAASGAAIARAASMAGIDVTKFAAWGNAVAASGGNAAAAEQSLANLAGQQAAVRFGQRPSAAMMALAQVGIRPGEDPTQIMRDLASNRTVQAMSPSERTYFLQGMVGLDQGSAYVVSQGPAAVAKYLAAQAKKGNETPAQAAALQKLVEQTNLLRQSFEQVTLELTAQAAPAMTAFARTMTDFVQGFTHSALYKLIASSSTTESGSGLNAMQSDANRAGAWVHKWVSEALQFPSSDSNPLPGVGPRGLRNNNPLNLKFAGQPGAHADSGGFAVFSSMEAGVGADYHQMLLDYGRGDNTINKLVPAWTTTDRGPYTATVLKQMKSYGYNLTGDSKLDLRDPKTAQALISAMSVAEGNGSMWIPNASGLPGSVTNVLKGLRSPSSRYASGVVHHHGATEINVSVNVPSGDPQKIAQAVHHELKRVTNRSVITSSGGMQ